MKKLLVFLFALLSAQAFGQAYSSTVLQNSAGNYGRPVPYPQVTVCSSGDTAVPCTQRAITYTDDTLSAQCSQNGSSGQLLGNPTSGANCNNPGVGDVNGNFTIYVAAGEYVVCAYSGTWLCQKQTIGGAAGGAGTVQNAPQFQLPFYSAPGSANVLNGGAGTTDGNANNTYHSLATNGAGTGVWTPAVGSKPAPPLTGNVSVYPITSGTYGHASCENANGTSCLTQPELDAFDYGCKEDGSTDDTACANALITAAGSTQSAAVWYGISTFASNVTFPSNLAIHFSTNGGFKPATSTTTTIKGDIVATPHQQIFFNAYASQGLIDLTGDAIVTTVYPEWWGAVANNSSDGTVNQEAIQAAELGAYGTAGSGRTNASGNTIWNRELHFSGQYTVSGTINAYHMIGFSWTCANRNTCGLVENTSNAILLNGQSVAYGEFRNMSWTTTASQDVNHPLVVLDYNGSQGSDLKPQFIDFYSNNFGGAQVAQTGVQIAPSGGNAQGSNIAFYNSLFLSFNQACLMIGLGSNGTPTNLATNAVAVKVIGGDFQDCVGYGMANYGGGIIDINGTTFEDGTDIWNSGARAQTGYDMLCYIAVNGEWCSAENVRSESLYTLGGFGWIINGVYNVDGQRVLTPGSSPPVGAVIQGSSAGGHGVYYQVTGSTSAASGLGTTASPLTAASGTTTSITDNTGGFTANAWVGWEVSLIGVPYQYCIITSNTSSTFTCSAGWVVDWLNTATVTPGSGTQYIVEPNWGTQTTSGGVTWAAMTKYILGCAGCGTNNLSIINNLFVPGLQVYGPQSNWLGFTSTRSDAFIFQGNGYLTYSGASPGVQVSAGLSGAGAGGGGGTIDFGHIRKPLFYQTSSTGVPGGGTAVGATNGLSYLHGVQSLNCWYGSPFGASGSLGVDLCEGVTVGGANTGAWYVDNASGSTTPKRLLYDATGTLHVPNGVIAPVPSINTQTASYHLLLTDASGYVRMNVASANNLTVDPDSTTNFPTGTVITIRQINTGQTTIVAGSGVTISTPSSLLIRAQNSTVQLIKVASNTWDLAGDVQ